RLGSPWIPPLPLVGRSKQCGKIPFAIVASAGTRLFEPQPCLSQPLLVGASLQGIHRQCDLGIRLPRLSRPTQPVEALVLLAVAAPALEQAITDLVLGHRHTCLG